MINKKHNLLVTKKRKSVLFDLIIWAISFVILLYSFNQNSSPKKIDFIYTASFLATIIIPVFINIYILIPLFLKREKYIWFSVLLVVDLLVFSQLNVLFFDHLIDYFFPNYYFISYHSNIRLISIFGIFLIGFTLIKLSQDWLIFNKERNKELKIKNQEIQNQLSTLRSQINPHFLFNSLNVIYALALENKKNTTDAIVQLSDILRYIIYDSNKKMVLLTDEIQLLKNYIHFQKHRQHTPNNIDFSYETDNKAYTIYPMLLLPLVENSFKHGIKGDVKNTFINIRISLLNNKFTFVIENNNNSNNEEEGDNHSGFGLESIKNNLKLVYPNKHLLQTVKGNKMFRVTLKIYAYDN